MKYRAIAKFRSNSHPDRIYTVKLDEVGRVSCDCPAWIYKANGKRECKHTRYVWANLYDGKGHFFLPITDIPTAQEAEKMGENKEEERRWNEVHLKIIQL